MSFKENLLKKIEIEAIGARVMISIGAPDSGIKIDRQAMVQLLGMTDYAHQKERDLDLYVRPIREGRQEILVLDNELALYQTTIADVVLRKSPTLKEMISIRNAIKILNDKDVVLAKRSETIAKIKNELIGALDLAFTTDDVAAIVSDGAASLEKAYGDGVEECLILLAEMLGYKKAPKQFEAKHQIIFGVLDQGEIGRELFGPMVVYSRIHNTLRWIERQINSKDNAQIMEWRKEITADAPSDRMGENVLLHLSKLVKPLGATKGNKK